MIEEGAREGGGPFLIFRLHAADRGGIWEGAREGGGPLLDFCKAACWCPFVIRRRGSRDRLMRDRSRVNSVFD